VTRPSTRTTGRRDESARYVPFRDGVVLIACRESMGWHVSQIASGAAMTAASAPLPTPVSRSRYLLIGAAAAIAQMLMMVPGYNEDGDFQVGEWLIVLLISLVVAAALFTFVVPHGGAVSAWSSRWLH
jgi:hypothetical protein